MVVKYIEGRDKLFSARDKIIIIRAKKSNKRQFSILEEPFRDKIKKAVYILRTCLTEYFAYEAKLIDHKNFGYRTKNFSNMLFTLAGFVKIRNKKYDATLERLYNLLNTCEDGFLIVYLGKQKIGIFFLLVLETIELLKRLAQKFILSKNFFESYFIIKQKLTSYISKILLGRFPTRFTSNLSNNDIINFKIILLKFLSEYEFKYSGNEISESSENQIESMADKRIRYDKEENKIKSISRKEKTIIAIDGIYSEINEVLDLWIRKPKSSFSSDHNV